MFYLPSCCWQCRTGRLVGMIYLLWVQLMSDATPLVCVRQQVRTLDHRVHGNKPHVIYIAYIPLVGAAEVGLLLASLI